MRIVWTETAGNDLRAIHAYIARDSVVYANRMIQRLKQSVSRLKRFPLSGGMVLEWGRDDVREVVCDNYRVIYRVGSVVEILTVIHGARELPLLP